MSFGAAENVSQYIMGMPLNISAALVMLTRGTDMSPPLLGADVTVNSYALIDSMSNGQYMYVNYSGTVFTPGMQVGLHISCSEGAAACTITATEDFSITAPADGTFQSAAAGFGISWTYPGNIPPLIYLSVGDTTNAYVTQTIPGTDTSYNVPGGVLPSSGDITITLQTMNNSPITGVNAGSADFIYLNSRANTVKMQP